MHACSTCMGPTGPPACMHAGLAAAGRRAGALHHPVRHAAQAGPGRAGPGRVGAGQREQGRAEGCACACCLRTNERQPAASYASPHAACTAALRLACLQCLQNILEVGGTHTAQQPCVAAPRRCMHASPRPPRPAGARPDRPQHACAADVCVCVGGGLRQRDANADQWMWISGALSTCMHACTRASCLPGWHAASLEGERQGGGAL